MANLIGRTLGRYKLTSLLGEGGMGSVYKASDLTLQRDVAIKIMHAQYARKPSFRERFLQEARTAAKLSHPSVVSVHDFGQTGESLYIVMEYIPGANLSQLLKDMRAQGKWIRLDEGVEIVRQVAMALDFAHKQGVLHRDIKPGNIMLRPEQGEILPFRPVVTDLGLAKLVSEEGITQEGTSMGTPAYMSPEQAMGMETDARSDVYSCGVLLYELAVGRLPFPARTLTEAIRYHSKEQPPSPRTIRADLPVPLERAILIAMEKDPARRFPHAAEMAKSLEAIFDSVTAVAGMPTAIGPAESLNTQFQQSMMEVRGASVMEDFSAPSLLADSEARIQVLSRDKTTHTVQFKSSAMTIGRVEGADLVLDDEKVSREHARVEYDGLDYRVTDLNSTNGTFLGDVRLLPGVPEVWHPEKALRIGGTWLRLLLPAIKSTSTTGTGVYRRDGTQIEADMLSMSSGEGRVAVYIDQPGVRVDPGSRSSVDLVLLNQGPVVDHFSVKVAGIPSSWVELPPAAQLLPGEQRTVQLGFQPPKGTHTGAGVYSARVRVTSQESPAQIAEVSLQVTVGAYQDFKAEMHPTRVRSGSRITLRIHNSGNHAENYSISLRDRADELAFKPPQINMQVPAGGSGTLAFTGKPRKRRWIGGENQHPFTVQVAPPQGDAQTLSGEILARALLPAWVIPALLFLCVMLAGAAGLYYVNTQQQVARLTATAATAVAQLSAAQATDLASTEIAAEVTALAATQVAATAKAEGDDDNDGLSNVSEQAAGTDPNNPDTDGDGLNDGAELNQHGTNPKNQDSDGDTIPDGVEVNELNTSPTNVDTDGDGQNDNVDADPRLPPTPTLTPTITPTPTEVIPPGGVSLNCDDTYQRFRLEDFGSDGKKASVDRWDGTSWVNVWSFESGDPMLRQIEDDAGLYSFGACRQLIVIPLRYGGSGASLTLYIYKWTGSDVEEALRKDGTHGQWTKTNNVVQTTASVYLFGEPNCCPCNREVINYEWDGNQFQPGGARIEPTYSGDPPEYCTP